MVRLDSVIIHLVSALEASLTSMCESCTYNNAFMHKNKESKTNNPFSLTNNCTVVHKAFFYHVIAQITPDLK